MEIMGLSLSDFFAQLMGIVVVDLVLGGDNAIVIGMACRNLPERLRFKGIVLGTIGAVIVRAIATVVIVWLMSISLVMLIGGVALIVIGCKLMIKEESGPGVKAADSLFRAVITVIAADAIMGIDNVLAVAGVAHGHPIMVIIGLCISVPIMVLGSTLVVKLMNRFSFIVYIGAAVILYTAGTMITDEPLTEVWFHEHEAIKWILIIAVTGGGLLYGFLYNRKKSKKEIRIPSGPDNGGTDAPENDK
ncbi:MAG: TerC family protein [Clostridiales Family XIII bacterium]|jgi:YjbE family integral membrane protein|nr:TerC family protein [Clostridiales Family XIII bacterium]